MRARELLCCGLLSFGTMSQIAFAESPSSIEELQGPENVSSTLPEQAVSPSSSHSNCSPSLFDSNRISHLWFPSFPDSSKDEFVALVIVVVIVAIIAAIIHGVTRAGSSGSCHT